MSVLLQTLHVTGTRSLFSLSGDGGGPTETATNDAAGTQDANDATKDAAVQTTSTFILYAVEYDVDTLVTNATIDFVRVKFRARGGVTNTTPAQKQAGALFYNSGHLLDSGDSYQCDSGSVELDSDPTVWVDFVQDFLTQDGSTPWDVAAVNGTQWGFNVSAFTNDPPVSGMDTNAECSELSVEVWGTPATTKTITGSLDSGLTADPTFPITVTIGNDQHITVTADDPDVRILDYYSVDAGDPIFWDSPDQFDYDFLNVTEDHDISFVSTYPVFHVTATAGAGGSVSPSGLTDVLPQGSLTITITPSAGHHIVDVTLDKGLGAGPESQGAVSSVPLTDLSAVVYGQNIALVATFAANSTSTVRTTTTYDLGFASGINREHIGGPNPVESHPEKNAARGPVPLARNFVLPPGFEL